eukprot:1439920-Rhodomonas_salina.2
MRNTQSQPEARENWAPWPVADIKSEKDLYRYKRYHMCPEMMFDFASALVLINTFFGTKPEFLLLDKTLQKEAFFQATREKFRGFGRGIQSTSANVTGPETHNVCNVVARAKRISSYYIVVLPTIIHEYQHYY